MGTVGNYLGEVLSAMEVEPTMRRNMRSSAWDVAFFSSGCQVSQWTSFTALQR